MVEIGFYTLSVIMLATPAILYAKDFKKQYIKHLAIGLVWLLYIIIMVKMGWVSGFNLPPKGPLFIVFPAILIAIGVNQTKVLQRARLYTPWYLPVILQSFRVLVELLIYGGFINGVLPQRATFEGLNYDILVGLSAIVMGVLIKTSILKRWAILTWNFVAMMILSVTAYSFIHTYYFTDYVSNGGSAEFLNLPYILLPGVLLPIAVFFHIFSIQQTKPVR